MQQSWKYPWRISPKICGSCDIRVWTVLPCLIPAIEHGMLHTQQPHKAAWDFPLALSNNSSEIIPLFWCPPLVPQPQHLVSQWSHGKSPWVLQKSNLLHNIHMTCGTTISHHYIQCWDENIVLCATTREYIPSAFSQSGLFGSSKSSRRISSTFHKMNKNIIK